MPFGPTETLTRRGARSLLLASSLASACAMGQKVMFSEVEGEVVRNGTPVLGATIEREYRWSWNGKQGADTTTTDSAGRFRLPELTQGSWFSGLVPHEPVIQQRLTIRHEGKPYEAWVYIKHNYDRKGELGGRALRLHCDLATEARRVETGPYGDGYFGICDLR